LELAWRLLRAGRARDASRWLEGLPPDAHSELPALRVAAEALRSGADARALLPMLLTTVSHQQPSPISLRLVVLVALAAGDRSTALDAARHYLGTVYGDDPELRALLAPEQVLAGASVEAAASAERAAAGCPGEPERPIRAIHGALGAAGRPDLVLMWLAEGFLGTGRDVYGELLQDGLTGRLRQHARALWLGIAAVTLGVGLAVTGLRGLEVAVVLLAVAGIALIVRIALVRAPGATRAQTKRILAAYDKFRGRTGRPDVLVAAPTAAGVFTMTSMLGRGNAPSLTAAAVAVMAGIGLAIAAATAGVAWLIGRQRGRRRSSEAAAAEPSAEHCQCWATDVLAGQHWRRYLQQHLDPLGADPSIPAELMGCKLSGKTWLYLPTAHTAVTVRQPVSPGPEPPTAAYL
jgi:hypothetical protein